MHLRECVVSVTGRTCVETTAALLAVVPYILGRCLECIARDMLSKLDDLKDVDAYSLAFT